MSTLQSSSSQSKPFPLVGRREELALLTETLAKTALGNGSLVLISGEAGVGKSRLLSELGSQARKEGWIVLNGRGLETSGMPPCLPILEAIREYVRSFPNSERIRVLVDLPEVSALIPEIAAEKSTVPASGSVTPETARLRLFDGIADFLDEVSQSAGGAGLVLCLDDLHWADQTTLLLVLHIARKAGTGRLVVTGAYRVEDAEQSSLADFVASFARDRLGERIFLTGFSLPETREFVAEMIGAAPDPAVVEKLHSQTNGNAFFIEESVRQLSSEGRDLTDSEPALETWHAPESVRAVIAQRYSGMSADAKGVLQVGSVIGSGFSVRLVQSITGLTDEAAVAAFEEASAAALLREDGERYVFHHPIIQRVLYESLSLARRQQLHARVAVAIEPAVSSNAERAWAAIGHHWRLGGRPERAIEFYLRAGDAALSMTAWPEAASFWEAAESCMAETGQPAARRARLLEGTGDLYFLGSFGVWECVERYKKAADLYKAAGDLSGWRVRSLAPAEASLTRHPVSIIRRRSSTYGQRKKRFGHNRRALNSGKSTPPLPTQNHMRCDRVPTKC